MQAMDGVILLNKPAGMTSFKAVNQCRHRLAEKKAGHTGTLDPNAQGLLIVLLGRCTKLTPYCIHNHKQYHAEFILGTQYDTEDIWGSAVSTEKPSSHTEEELAAAARSFVGIMEQVPPMYSAVKVNGQKLYQLARKGKEVERKARIVKIDHLEVHHLHDDTYSMDAVVSSGTYIRTLISDFCQKIGEYGAMSFLERRGIEEIHLDEAVDFDHLEQGFIDPARIIDPSWKLVDGSKEADRIRHGVKLKLPHEEKQIILTEGNDLLAAYIKEEDGFYHCQRGLF
jgi:tRNA pseudouridine55 synthase